MADERYKGKKNVQRCSSTGSIIEHFLPPEDQTKSKPRYRTIRHSSSMVPRNRVNVTTFALRVADLLSSHVVCRELCREWLSCVGVLGVELLVVVVVVEWIECVDCIEWLNCECVEFVCLFRC